MIETVKIIIPGTPVSKGRPRFAVRGKYVQTYTPEKTAAYEKLVRSAWEQAGGKTAPQGAAVRVDIVASFPIPGSKSKKIKAAMAAGEIPHLSRPDVDNIAKAVLDALNGCAYHDDSQIVSLTVEKQYAETPRCAVRLEWEEA